YNAVANGWSAGSIELNQAFADAVAATILTALLSALSLTGVGLIVVGIIALVDGILTLICEVADIDTSSELTNGGCFTLTGFFTTVVALTLYGFHVMVDAEADDFVDIGDPVSTLRDAEAGYTVGNVVDLKLPVTTTVQHDANFGLKAPQLAAYLWFFSGKNLRSTTVSYSATVSDGESLTVERNQMSDDWEMLDNCVLFCAAKEVETVSVDLELGQPGLNQEFDVYLNLGYAFPAAECWYVPVLVPVPVCYGRSIEDGTSSPFDTRYYDVLPADLDGFLALEPVEGGFRLAWDESFDVLDDADGDGVLSTRAGGLDSDDSNADRDGDGLTDLFELERQERGVASSPDLDDSDSDGLSDLLEYRFGTNPGVADTDNDGLADGDEVRYVNSDEELVGGWDVTVYRNVSRDDESGVISVVPDPENDWTVPVSSDPLSADADGDGIGDQAEKQLAASGEAADRVDANGVPFNPNVFNISPFTIALGVDAPDGYVRPGDTVTLTTEGFSSRAMEQGAVSFDTPGQIDGLIDPVLLAFDPTVNGQQSVSADRSFTVAADAATGSAVIEASGTVRLPSTSGGVWNGRVWNVAPVQSENRADGGRYSKIDVDAAPASSDSYLTTAETTYYDALSRGDVRVFPSSVPTLPEQQLEVDTWQYESMNRETGQWSSLTGTSARRTGDGVATTCLSGPDCLTVWAEYEDCYEITIRKVVIGERDPEFEKEPGGGFEPGIFIDNESDTDGPQLVWWSGDYGGDWGPGTTFEGGYGLPVRKKVCGFDLISLSVEEANGPDSNDFRKFNWSPHGRVQEEGAFAGDSDTECQDTLFEFPLDRNGGRLVPGTEEVVRFAKWRPRAWPLADRCESTMVVYVSVTPYVETRIAARQFDPT
ncbi:MAG: hypothetical protein RLZZ01_453, partial [Actinomycetota bacterium]